MQPTDIIKEATVDIYAMIMYIIAGIVAFLIVILISKNLTEMAQGYIAGRIIKLKKRHRIRDIYKFGGDDEWYLDSFNTYTLTFLKVLKWDKIEIHLGKDEMILQYLYFIKRPIIKIGRFGD